MKLKTKFCDIWLIRYDRDAKKFYTKSPSVFSPSEVDGNSPLGLEIHAAITNKARKIKAECDKFEEATGLSLRDFNY